MTSVVRTLTLFVSMYVYSVRIRFLSLVFSGESLGRWKKEKGMLLQKEKERERESPSMVVSFRERESGALVVKLWLEKKEVEGGTEY